MSFVPTEPSGDPLLREPESESTPPGGTPRSAVGGDLQLPLTTRSSEPAPSGADFSSTGFSEGAPWPFGVADAAAEFAAIQAKIAASSASASAPAEPPSVPVDFGAPESPQPAVPAAASAPVWAGSSEPTWTGPIG